MSQNKTAIALLIVWALTLIWVLFDEGVFADESYFYARLGAGKNATLFNDDNKWDDNGELGCGAGFGYRHNISGRWYGDLSYTHHSQCLSGPPVNNDEESTSDHAYYWVEWRLK